MRKDRIIGKRISVLGMARSGLACARLLKRTGAEVFVSDVEPQESFSDQTNQLKALGIDFETGGHTSKVVRGKDFIVLSPGVPLDIPILKQAQDLGIPALSEIEVAFWLTDSKIIGITGSNGKTTTVTLVGEMLKQDQRECRVGGNIGIPFSDVVEKVSPDGLLVLELSSFQLERIEEFKPYVSSVLNITPDHLDRHPDLESYMEAKLRILENQTENDFAVLNSDDENSLKLAKQGECVKVFFSARSELEQGTFLRKGQLLSRWKGAEEEIIDTSEIGIKGPHNLSNALAACAICVILEVAPESIRKALKDFKGVEHRLEHVAAISGVSFVNDSKATNVESVWYALQSVSSPIILIAGGRDKGGDFSRLRDLVRENVKTIVLIGEAKEKIKNALGNLIPSHYSDSLEEAVTLSLGKASGGDTVLLSPGCASFDMFTDYQHRGEVFKSSVRSLEEKGDSPIDATGED
ncbi:MAG: UDP-N-acetylmuramoyl-L-alanine--D-glutamate ligase [Candidatus Zixiibacteriota bacterium]|nr:MAG: UDP-N-acetylmuramoyl-L-alanine--D-glutamate ligase [candidate division Zixibacteria bacterium]